jgi:hypothetical protein
MEIDQQQQKVNKTRRRTSASQKCFHPAEKEKKTRAITFNEPIAVKAFDCLPDFA